MAVVILLCSTFCLCCCLGWNEKLREFHTVDSVLATADPIWEISSAQTQKSTHRLCSGENKSYQTQNYNLVDVFVWPSNKINSNNNKKRNKTTPSTAQRTDFCVLSPYMHSAHINTMSHGSACRLVVPMWKFYGQLFYDQCAQRAVVAATAVSINKMLKPYPHQFLVWYFTSDEKRTLLRNMQPT